MQLYNFTNISLEFRPNWVDLILNRKKAYKILKILQFYTPQYIIEYFHTLWAATSNNIMQPHRFFLVTALLFGTLYALIVPPFQAPDEFNHFYRSWQIADGGGLTGKKTADNRLGDSLPTSLLIISEPFSHLPFHFEQHIKSNTIFSLLETPLNPQQRTFIDFTNTTVYAPTAYLSQVTAIFLFKSLGFGPLSIFYLSRLLTLIFWITIVYTSIKTIPIQKWLFAFLALLPSSLFINASMNADVLTNALSFLTISLFVKFFFEKNKISKIDILTLFIATLIISLNKVAYLPLVLLVFLIPKNNFSTAKQKYIFAFSLIAANLAVVFWWSKTIAPLYIRYEDYNPNFRIGQQLNEGVDPVAQLSFVLHNPLTFTKIMMTSFAKTLPHTLVHYVGKFGWEKNYLPIWLILPLFLTLILRGVKKEDSQEGLSKNLRLKIIGIAFIISGSLATTIYLIWCKVGSDFIENLSGKYFIPIFPLFFLALPTLDIKKLRFFITERNTAILLWLTLSYGVWQVLERYYCSFI